MSTADTLALNFVDKREDLVGDKHLSRMGKMWVEVCLISARGLRRTSALWKLQWYAVGWIDPNNKYCTKIDASGNANPVWRTKFASMVEPSVRDLALHVEVYSREPVFLRERLQGTATIVLKEFLAEHGKNSEASAATDVGSYQLRKGNSNKPQGFVDVSIRISQEREDPSLYAGKEGEIQLTDHNNDINFQTTQSQPQRPENHLSTNLGYNQPTRPFPETYSNPNYSSAAGPSYPPPPPPPPANVGYVPTFLPQNCINLPPSGRGGGGLGFGAGVGAGALAAGALIFGDDFMSGFSVPAGLQDASLTISTDSPF